MPNALRRSRDRGIRRNLAVFLVLGLGLGLAGLSNAQTEVPNDACGANGCMEHRYLDDNCSVPWEEGPGGSIDDADGQFDSVRQRAGRASVSIGWSS